MNGEQMRDLKASFPYLHECEGKWIGSTMPGPVRCLTCGYNEHPQTS